MEMTREKWEGKRSKPNKRMERSEKKSKGAWK